MAPSFCGCFGKKKDLPTTPGEPEVSNGNAPVPTEELGSDDSSNTRAKKGAIAAAFADGAERRERKEKTVTKAHIRFTAGLRKKQASWLVSVCDQIDRDDEQTKFVDEGALLTKLVSHRGFHSADDSILRPIENSLEAYVCAWESGVVLTECDVAATLDGAVVLLHDDNMKRLCRNFGALGRYRRMQWDTVAVRIALSASHLIFIPAIMKKDCIFEIWEMKKT